MWETNKTSRQEVCTTYVGRRRPSVLPKERRYWGLPGQILEAQAKLVSMVGSTLQMETQPEFEREREQHGETSISRNWSQFFIFHGLLLYTEMLYKSHMGTAVLTFIKVRCFIQMYTEVLGCYIIFWPGGLLTIYDPLLVTTVSQPGHLFLQGWLFLKQTPPSQGTK